MRSEAFHDILVRDPLAFIPAATDLHHSVNIARVRTVAQTVPSLATLLMVFATSFTRLAQIFLTVALRLELQPRIDVFSSMVLAPVQPTTDLMGAVPSDLNLRSDTGDETVYG